MFTAKSDTETRKKPLHTPTTSNLGSEHYRDINTLNIPDSVRVDIRKPDREKYFGWYLKLKKSDEGETETAESGEGKTTMPEPDALYLVDPFDSESAEGEKEISEQKKTNITVIHTDDLQRAVCDVLFVPAKRGIECMPIRKAESCFLESVYKKPVFEIISNKSHQETSSRAVGRNHSFIGLRYTAYDPFLKTYVRKCIRFGYNGNLMVDTNSAYEGGVQKKIDYDQVKGVFQYITKYFDNQKLDINNSDFEYELNASMDELKGEENFEKRDFCLRKYYNDGDPRNPPLDEKGKKTEVVNCFTFARDIAKKMGLGEYFESESNVYNPGSLADEILNSLGKNRGNAKYFITEEKATARREKRKSPLNAQGALTEKETFKERYWSLRNSSLSDIETRQSEKAIKRDIKELQSQLETLRAKNISDGKTISEIKTYCTKIRKQILSLVNSFKARSSEEIEAGYKKYRMLEFARLFSQIKTQLDSYDLNMFLYLGKTPDKTQMEFFDKIGALPSPDVLFVRLLEEIKAQMETEGQELINTDLSSNNFNETPSSLYNNMSNRETEDSFSSEWSSIQDDELSAPLECSVQDDEPSASIERSFRDDELYAPLGCSVQDDEPSASIERSFRDDELYAPLGCSVQDDESSVPLKGVLRVSDLDAQIEELRSILEKVERLIKVRDDYNNGNQHYYNARNYDEYRDSEYNKHIKPKLETLKKYSDDIPEFDNDIDKFKEKLTECIKTRVEKLQEIFSKVFFEKIEQDVCYKYVLPSFYKKWRSNSDDPRNAVVFMYDDEDHSKEKPEIVKYFYKPFMEKLSKYIEEQKKLGYTFKDSSSTDNKK